MTTAQRAKLRSLAMTMQPCAHIGKNGLTDNSYTMLSDLLDSRELIKISVLPNCAMSAKDILREIADKLDAVPVQAIGNRAVLYRRSMRTDIKHIQL
ncbi:MAG: YhbY family RNA-binding protein [Clostridia bacterium]|nr:YhbY family RNA-binding protein [Clostridia bacterium]